MREHILELYARGLRQRISKYSEDHGVSMERAVVEYETRGLRREYHDQFFGHTDEIKALLELHKGNSLVAISELERELVERDVQGVMG